MYVRVRLYSNKAGEIYRFLCMFFENKKDTSAKNAFSEMYLNSLLWENIYTNPIEISTIVGVYADNIDKFQINMWISLDKDVFIKITENNADQIIKYLYERFPY